MSKEVNRRNWKRLHNGLDRNHKKILKLEQELEDLKRTNEEADN